jgi:hypothetical protein
MAIVSTYIPMIVKQVGQEAELTLGGAALGIGALFLLAMALPFLAGFENVIGLAIIAFGLYEAWKLWTREGLLVLLAVVAGLRAFSAGAPAEGDRKATVQFLLLLAVLSAMCLIPVPLGEGTAR